MDTIKAFLEVDAMATCPYCGKRPHWTDGKTKRTLECFNESCENFHVPFTVKGWTTRATAPAIRTMLADIEMAREALRMQTCDLQVSLDMKREALSALDKYKGGV